MISGSWTGPSPSWVEERPADDLVVFGRRAGRVFVARREDSRKGEIGVSDLRGDVEFLARREVLLAPPVAVLTRERVIRGHVCLEGGHAGELSAAGRLAFDLVVALGPSVRRLVVLARDHDDLRHVLAVSVAAVDDVLALVVHVLEVPGGSVDFHQQVDIERGRQPVEFEDHLPDRIFERDLVVLGGQ